jgi:hypothetical protein
VLYFANLLFQSVLRPIYSHHHCSCLPQVRPPQPPVYFFLIDVSEPALVSGMLHSMTRAIKASLDELPGGNRAQVGELLGAGLCY